jgi:hypothetical protein
VTGLPSDRSPADAANLEEEKEPGEETPVQAAVLVIAVALGAMEFSSYFAAVVSVDYGSICGYIRSFGDTVEISRLIVHAIVHQQDR